MTNKRLNVTRREFSDSYRRHYRLYKNTIGDSKTRRLILFYSVECGLKSLIMKNTGNDTYEKLEKYCKGHGKGELVGHNIKEMLKEVNPRNAFVLKNIELKGSGGSVEPKKFNEMWRYGVAVADAREEEKAEYTLAKIAEWLNTRL